MARRRLPQQGILGDFREPAPAKPKLPPGVVVKNDRWYVRIRYRGADGQRHAAWRECAKSATHAKEVRKALEKELDDHGPVSLTHTRRTWGELAKYYKANYLIPAIYVDDRKAAGRRSLAGPKSQLERLSGLIGENTKVREMDYEFWRQLRLQLVALPTRATKAEPHGHQRSMVDVDRHLALGRHMFKVARSGLHWIHHDPFADALKPLVTPADERKRRRVMSFAEENALLAHCVDEREHLRLVIIGLVDSLTRSESEFFKLRVADLDLQSRRINVQQMNTKTLVARAAPISKRFANELAKWIEKNGLGPDDNLFPFESVKTAWTTLKRKAGVINLRLKDLRRTGATRLLRAGHPMEEISQLLGHKGIAMTYEYFGLDKDTTARAVEVLDAMHVEVQSEAESEAVN